MAASCLCNKAIRATKLKGENENSKAEKEEEKGKKLQSK